MKTLTGLKPYDVERKVWRVVIETPKGCHNKYAFDPELGLFQLKGVLPEGMAFPFDFGFVPSTIGEDGDPLDVMVLMDEPISKGAPGAKLAPLTDVLPKPATPEYGP